MVDADWEVSTSRLRGSLRGFGSGRGKQTVALCVLRECQLDEVHHVEADRPAVVFELLEEFGSEGGVNLDALTGRGFGLRGFCGSHVAQPFNSVEANHSPYE